MSIIKFLRSDDHLDESSNSNDHLNEHTSTIFTTLEDLIRNKSRREFIYEQVYQKKTKP